MIWNENFVFARDARPTDQKAFVRSPQRILINDRTAVYRWSNYRLSTSHPDVSEWWCFVESRRLSETEVFDGFRARETRARRIGKTHREYARARLAISEKFDNEMTVLVLARLKVPVWGFCGVAAFQTQFDDERRKAPSLKNVLFIGGSYQLYIPRLRYPDHLEDDSPVTVSR